MHRIKSEVKKPKDIPIPEAVVAPFKCEKHVLQALVSIPDDILDHISTSEKNANEKQQVSNKAKKEANSLHQEQEKLNYDLRSKRIKSMIFAKEITNLKLISNASNMIFKISMKHQLRFHMIIIHQKTKISK